METNKIQLKAGRLREVAEVFKHAGVSLKDIGSMQARLVAKIWHMEFTAPAQHMAKIKSTLEQMALST